MDTAASTPLAYIIEDEAPLADIFARALQNAGYQTLALNDGQVAIERLRGSGEAPRLVVLDLNLPHVSGKDILRYIRAHERFSGTRIIIATSESAVITQDLESSSDLVLLKPISPRQLRDLASRFHQ